MNIRYWIKHRLPKVLRPTPFEVMLVVGVLLFLTVVGSIVWGILPSSSLGRYESSIGARARATGHFPNRRADLPEGSRFYRAMQGSTLILYTPETPAAAGALLDGLSLTMRGEASVLEEMRPALSEVAPPTFDPQREGAVWGRVSAPPRLGAVWCDPATGEIIYFARADPE